MVTVIDYLTQPLRGMLWYGIDGWVRRSFPQVATLTPEQLDTWERQGTDPILLDVRTAEEFAVSHLPQAYHAPTVEAVQSMDLDPRRPVVAYCSVGYRSARLMAQLQDRGFTQGYNLEGSLFRWANQGRPLECAGKPTTAVHPYNAVWGLLLNPCLGCRQNHG
jgi:rhodanese-related sulfurtransferase